MYKLAQRNAFFSEVTKKVDLAPFGNKLFIYRYHVFFLVQDLCQAKIFPPLFFPPLFCFVIVKPYTPIHTTSLYLPMNYRGGQTAGLAFFIRFNAYTYERLFEYLLFRFLSILLFQLTQPSPHKSPYYALLALTLTCTHRRTNFLIM